ncbi:histidine phosphatase family protein [Thermodesulfobacteriota bacterium]
MTYFALLRHAQTEWNQNKRIQGQMNSPLTPKGKTQAKKWGRILKKQYWNRIITSDTGRAIETSDLINAFLKVPLTCDSRLREQDWGLWTGKTLAQLKKEVPRLFTDQVKAGWKFRPPGGEDRNTVLERSKNALKAAGKEWAGERILVVTHEGVIKCLIYHLYGRKFLPTEQPLIRSRHLHWIVHDRGGIKSEKINALPLN